MTVKFKSINSSDEIKFTTGTPRKYSQRSTIQHWFLIFIRQLRDLILCPDANKRKVIYVNQMSVNWFDTQTQTVLDINKSSSALNDLSFSPTSIASGCGYLAAGGQRSQLMVKELNSDW